MSASMYVSGDEIAISIKSPPERGRTKRELVKKLSAHFNVPEDWIRVISRLTSRKKIVGIL
jgi:uncharacterized protein YggU (UPF0235/DUF167 family)